MSRRRLIANLCDFALFVMLAGLFLGMIVMAIVCYDNPHANDIAANFVAIGFVAFFPFFFLSMFLSDHGSGDRRKFKLSEDGKFYYKPGTQVRWSVKQFHDIYG